VNVVKKCRGLTLPVVLSIIITTPCIVYSRKSLLTAGDLCKSFERPSLPLKGHRSKHLIMHVEHCSPGKF
jgi:hypothetical protein